MSTKPITDFVEGFLTEQEERERLAQEKRASECETIKEGFRGILLEALGVEALAALKPDWGVEILSASHFRAQVVLHYKGETLTIKDKGGKLAEAFQKQIARLLVEIDEEQRERATARLKLAATLMTRPLPDHVTSSWWNRIQHIVGDDAGLLADWDAAMVIFDERVQEAKAQDEKRRQEALDASREFMLEVVAAVEHSDDEKQIKALRDDIPRTIVHEDMRAIQQAAFERLQELDLEYVQQQEARKERVLERQRAGFWPFYFYEVHYQTGVFYEEGHPGVETAKLNCYAAECTLDGWWVTAGGRRVRLPFVSKVVERIVCAPGDFWPSGLWEVKETDDGLNYCVPSPLAVRADVDACAQAKEV